MKRTGIMIHHSASPCTTTANEIDEWHRKRGWSGIGYHYVVRFSCDTGRWLVEHGRPIDAIGSHCRGCNRTHIGVVMCGNYELYEVPPMGLALLIELLTMICAENDIPPTAIIGHRDRGSTLCPGASLYDEIEDIRAAVRDRLPLMDQHSTAT
jgi:N-acetylmuramoyl-L-alanine amidase